jgi:BolA protein
MIPGWNNTGPRTVDQKTAHRRVEERTVEQTPTAQAIKEVLCRKLAARHVEVLDQSAGHENHPGARDGGGYFQILVVAERFEGLSRLAAQRLVYEALSDLMERDIHALQMRTLTPERWNAEKSSVRS